MSLEFPGILSLQIQVTTKDFRRWSTTELHLQGQNKNYIIEKNTWFDTLNIVTIYNIYLYSDINKLIKFVNMLITLYTLKVDASFSRIKIKVQASHKW